MTQRSNCWSITINNPTKEEVLCQVPGWMLTGQYEQGENGTTHFQGMLKTPQVRFAAVKRIFPRAHIEAARSSAALAVYVSKEDTRVATYEAQGVPTIFQYQAIVANAWNEDDFEEHYISNYRRLHGDYGAVALSYVDSICGNLIANCGATGLEFVAVNPMWRTSWKKFWRSIINRNARPSPPAQARPQDETPAQGEDVHPG